MDEWTKFLAHSLSKRVDADRFGKYAQFLSNKYPLPPRRLADVLLRPSKLNCESFDPQIPYYVQTLLQSDILDLPAVLCGLLKYSSFRLAEDSKAENNERAKSLKWKKSGVQAEGVIYGLAKVVSSGARPKTTQEALQLVRALTAWMKVLAIAGPSDDIMQEAQAAEALGVRNALGTLLFAASENGKFLEVLGRSYPKGKQPSPVLEQILQRFCRKL